MRYSILLLVFVFCSFCFAQDLTQDDWIDLFDGATLNGWKFSEDEGTFAVKDSVIVVHGKRSHLYYIGEDGNAEWINFEFKADVKTEPKSNSGIYFHTAFQQEGWPAKGYEVQVNNSHSDWRRTGSLYNIVDLRESEAADNEWFSMHIIVQGKRIIIKVNEKQVIDYTEPENVNYQGMPGRKISSGTFCLQGHDPKSTVYFKNIMAKKLP
ncbi:DUF1080 domain-containing protein [candidate division KSB1 bacterium]|nr:DUF1080 domain-containing protein [candidate division KSB1 bacterium]RQW01533.1 MAG: DUF1080 domain-containing protein [candidate division KSB1 bacterium]